MVTAKKKVAVVGATGIAGQQFLAALHNHPWFEVTHLTGSDRNVGKTYDQALRNAHGQLGWWQAEPLPPHFARMKLLASKELPLSQVDMVFTAVDSEPARELEPLYAKEKPVISTASAFRMADDVPLLIPGINDNHKDLIKVQQARRNWKGFIVPIPNCTVYGLACSLAALKPFGIKGVVMTSMQAVSGAGRSSGVLGLDIVDNVVPFIPGEEEKVESEAQKIFGALQNDRVVAADFGVSATCTRVPVLDGHTEAVFVATQSPCSVAAATQAFREYKTNLQGLPTASSSFFMVHDDPYQPQPRMVREWAGGMPTHIGRIREESVLGGIKYVLLSHNTKAGAAKGAVLVAEMLVRDGLIV